MSSVFVTPISFSCTRADACRLCLKAQIDAGIQKAEQEKIGNFAITTGMNLEDFSHLIDALASSCTKEAITVRCRVKFLIIVLELCNCILVTEF